jgi:hypothetical protein
MHERIYVLPPRRVLYGRIGIFGMCILGVYTLVTFRAPPVLWILGLAVFSYTCWGVTIGMKRKAVRESAAGLRTSDLSGWRRTLTWDDIERFEVMRGTRKVMVGAVMTRGGTVPVIGLDASVTTRWDGGQTDDIVSELNKRLAGWRREGGTVRERAGQ